MEVSSVRGVHVGTGGGRRPAENWGVRALPESAAQGPVEGEPTCVQVNETRWSGIRIASSCPRWLYNCGVTLSLIHRKNGRRFLSSLVCASHLFTGWKAVCSGKSGGGRIRSARAKAAFYPVSRQPGQTSGVRKRLPFPKGVTLSL